MALTLNPTRKAYVAFPQEGTAPIVEQMPLLVADNRVPMSAAQ